MAISEKLKQKLLAFFTREEDAPLRDAIEKDDSDIAIVLLKNRASDFTPESVVGYIDNGKVDELYALAKWRVQVTALYAALLEEDVFQIFGTPTDGGKRRRPPNKRLFPGRVD